MLPEDVSKVSGVFVVVAGRNFVSCLPPRMVLFSNEIPVRSVVKGGKTHKQNLNKLYTLTSFLHIFSLTNTLLRERNVFILNRSPQLVSALNANSGCSEVTYLRRYHQQH